MPTVRLLSGRMGFIHKFSLFSFTEREALGYYPFPEFPPSPQYTNTKPAPCSAFVWKLSLADGQSAKKIMNKGNVENVNKARLILDGILNISLV